MKKRFLTTLFVLLLGIGSVCAQNRGFSFQGYARDANGAPYADAPVSLRFTLTNSTGGTNYYQETQNVTSDANGTYSAIIGAGNIAAFNAVDFSVLPNCHLVVEVSLGGGIMVEVSREPLLQAPYAKWADNGLLPGMVMPFGGSKSFIPPGFLPCDGREVSIDEFRELFDVIGTRWGAAGAGMFRLPDLRGVFLRGQNDGRGDAFNDAFAGTRVSATGTGGVTGDQVGTFQADQLRSHGHSGSMSVAGEHDHTLVIPTSSKEDETPLNAVGMDDQNLGSKVWSTTTDGDHSHTVTVNNAGGAENRPRNASVYYIIKY